MSNLQGVKGDPCKLLPLSIRDPPVGYTEDTTGGVDLTPLYSRDCVPACAQIASWSRLRAGSPATHRPLGAACGQVGEVGTGRPGPQVLAANLRLIRQGRWQGPFSRRARTRVA